MSKVSQMIYECTTDSSETLPDPSMPTQVLTLSAEDCIQTLKKELFALHAKKQVFDGVEIP